MPEELEARIRKLEDIEEIKNLQAKYAYTIDTEQMERIPDLFADNFVAEYDVLGTYKTGPELVEFLKAAAERLPMMRHQMLTPYIEVNGDKATGTWYLFGPFTAVTTHGEVANWIQGKYENEYMRVGGKWKFSHLRFMFNFQSPYEDGWVKTPKMEVDESGSFR